MCSERLCSAAAPSRWVPACWVARAWGRCVAHGLLARAGCLAEARRASIDTARPPSCSLWPRHPSTILTWAGAHVQGGGAPHVSSNKRSAPHLADSLYRLCVSPPQTGAQVQGGGALHVPLPRRRALVPPRGPVDQGGAARPHPRAGEPACLGCCHGWGWGRRWTGLRTEAGRRGRIDPRAGERHAPRVRLARAACDVLDSLPAPGRHATAAPRSRTLASPAPRCPPPPPPADRHARQHEVHFRRAAAPAGRRVHEPLQARVPQVARAPGLRGLTA